MDPLLGLYAYGVFSKRKIMDQLVPLICVLAPVATYFISMNSEQLFWGYKFSFEILLVNGFITALGLYVSSFFEKREL